MTKLESMVKKNKQLKRPPQKLLGVRLDKNDVDDLMRLACRYNISLKDLVSAMVSDYLAKEFKSHARRS